MIDPFRRYEIYAESGLEANHLRSLIVDPDVLSIHEQYKVMYVHNRRRRVHYVDALVVRRSGLRTAYFVKYAADAAKEALPDLIDAIAAGADQDFADEFEILTEVNMDMTAIANSTLIARCGCHFDLDAEQAVRDQLPLSPPVVTPRSIAEQTGLGMRGSNALIALLQSGDVRLRQPSDEIALDTQFDNFVSRSAP